MAFAAEAQNTGFTLSESSLRKSHIKTFQNVCSSFPAVRPDMMSVRPVKEFVKIIKKIEEAYYQGFNRHESKDQKDSFSLEESKQVIRELAAELNRVVQFKKFSQMSGKVKNKGTQEEQQYYILQWAEELENFQRKQTDVHLLQEEKSPSLSEKSRLESEIKWNRAKEIVSRWAWRLKEMKENAVCPKAEYRDTLRDLHKQCKQGESSILPVMDWMMWTVLQSESSVDSSPRTWMKKKQRSKNTVGLCIPNSVWDWITKSKAVVVLDPNTANPELLVSKDGKSLRARNYHNNWKSFQTQPNRYNGWTCVQAKEGYNTGRYYWEVNVMMKCDWWLGVVKESAPRHGYVTMNTRTGYWNLRLQLGTLIALTEPVTKLYLPTPSKIGVYLDIEEGQVSFYDAQKRKHIYTFNTDFNGTENIYPLFGTIETDRELVII